MATSKIEWCDKVYNPVTGCTKVSAGCKNCYAERMAKRLAGRFGYPADDPFRVTLHPERLEDPLHWKKPCRIFVNSMSDLFHEDVPFEFIHKIVLTIRYCDWHTFMVLTKRPERMIDFFEWARLHHSLYYGNQVWPHLWLGVSVENQETADKRIPLLLQCSAAVRFISYEPALSDLDLSGFFGGPYCALPGDRIEPNYNFGIDWVIAGGESGPGARPAHPQWLRDVRDQCAAAYIPFFFKQWGEWAPGNSGAGGDLYPIDRTKITSGMFDYCGRWNDGGPNPFRQTMDRVGKARAGRLLDGRLHNEFPEAQP